MSHPIHDSLPPRRLDVAFSVPFLHRLRFTNDCFGADWPVLAELLEPSGTQAARAQVWIDDGLCECYPHLPQQIEQLFSQSQSRLSLTDPVQRLPGGEEVKNDPAYIDQILARFNRSDLDRRSYVIAVGGGALLDAVGFAAAIAHRGIRLIRVPTTTLAQADSGVGVKNAVNWFQKKNWKGSFAVPWGVINDQRLIEKLPDRDFRCGFSEAVKVSLLKDYNSFQYLRAHAANIAMRHMPSAIEAIRLSVTMHLDHITCGGDPFEMLQARPLDFGHWSAHKLEAITKYRIRHGEAVAIGVAVDVVYSSLVHGLSSDIVEQTLQTFADLGLPTYDPALSTTELFDGLEEFRQHLGGELTLTMLSEVGKPIEVHAVDYSAMRQAIQIVSRNQRTPSIPRENLRPRQPHITRS